MNELNDELDRLIASIVDAKVPPQLDERLRRQLTDFRTKPAGSPPSSWSIPFAQRSRALLGWSAAASVLAVSLVAWMLRPQVSLADVVAAVQKLPWIHVFRVDENGTRQELWYSAKNDVSASRDKNWVEFYDHKPKVYYSFDSQEKLLYRVPEFSSHRANDVAQLAEIAETLRALLRTPSSANKPFQNLNFLGPVGSEMELLDQSLDRINDNGQPCLEYHITARYSKVADPLRFTLRVDPATLLPRSIRYDAVWKGQAVVRDEQIDYPERGPASIYDLGVPQTAKIVDRVPSNDIARIVETIRAGRQRMDDYRALVVNRIEDPDYEWWSNELPMVFYRKGDKTRVDRAIWRGSFPHTEKPTAGEDMEKWWHKRAKDFIFCPFYITQGSQQYCVDIQPDNPENSSTHFHVKSVEKTGGSDFPPGENFPPYYSRSPEYVCRPPMGIPQQSLEPIVDTAPTDGPPGTILLRIARSGRVPGEQSPSEKDAKKFPHLPDVYRFWLDPKRDNVAMRWDMVDGSEPGKEQISSSTIVEELKQSPHGVWYATRFRVKAVPPVEHDQVFNVYPDFDDKLPDSLFVPPKVGSVIF